MASSGMLRRVALVRTDVSEGLSASFIRETKICEQGTTLAVTSNRRSVRQLLVTASVVLHRHSDRQTNCCTVLRQLPLSRMSDSNSFDCKEYSYCPLQRDAVPSIEF
jgi:hypothetical protein